MISVLYMCNNITLYLQYLRKAKLRMITDYKSLIRLEQGEGSPCYTTKVQLRPKLYWKVRFRRLNILWGQFAATSSQKDIFYAKKIGAEERNGARSR